MDWIACAERLPELTHLGHCDEATSEAVLAYHHATAVIEVLRRESAGWTYPDGALIHVRRISHWMPLPAPPVTRVMATEAR